MLIVLAHIFLTVILSFAVFFISGLSSEIANQPVSRRPARLEVKGLYLTGYTAGWKARREELIDLVEQTELNAVVVDIKDASGRIFFDTDIAVANKIGSEEIRIPDLKEWLLELKQKGIHTIARIVVFQDPFLAEQMPDIAIKSKSGGIWRDYRGQSWVDPTNKFIWEYNINLAKEAVKIGFDEINFDYIRFPSDGNINQIVYANLDKYENDKNKAIAAFYQFVGRKMAFVPALTSADLFGMTLWRSDGLNIGQRYQDAAPYFDYIAPMVYPSHYPPGFEGFENPADHPYEVVYRSLVRAGSLLDSPRAEVRPWLQDFDLGALYTPEMIELQKQAAYDSGSSGWLLWNASNRYTAGGLVSSSDSP